MKSEPVNVIPEIETNPVVFQQKEPEKKWKTVVKKYANRYFIDAFFGNGARTVRHAYRRDDI
ncbi:MAG: hypothetical protein L6V79_01420 [Clostridium sp.]|nr:MAG: hypothetical protein L6V79_01420 [Clostridium sp.]